MSTPHELWTQNDGDNTHRINYDLNPNSIVFDLGGYKGDWAQRIFEKYQSNLYVFEPVTEFYNIIAEKFKDYPRVKLHKFAAGHKDEDVEINISSDSSSLFGAFGGEGNKETIKIKDFTNFLYETKITNVNLIKINIEGSEYDLLESLAKNDKLSVFENIQVQFHSFIPNAQVRRDKIREILSKTHDVTYNYDFVWENWKRK